MIVRGDPSYKTEVLQISTQNVDFRGCHAGKHPHLPNYTWFWMIIMACISVTPSTSGQYGGKSQNLTFYPIIGFQYTTFHKGIDPKIRVIQCNMVNEEDFWSLKVILSRHVIKKLFYPKNGLDGAIMGTSQTKNSKCIGSNMVNHAQDWMSVKKFFDLLNKLNPSRQ